MIQTAPHTGVCVAHYMPCHTQTKTLVMLSISSITCCGVFYLLSNQNTEHNTPKEGQERNNSSSLCFYSACIYVIEAFNYIFLALGQDITRYMHNYSQALDCSEDVHELYMHLVIIQCHVNHRHSHVETVPTSLFYWNVLYWYPD